MNIDVDMDEYMEVDMDVGTDMKVDLDVDLDEGILVKIEIGICNHWYTDPSL